MSTVLSDSAVIKRARPAKTERFYRPELDVLRFIAFLAVFFCHGPRLHAGPGSSEWQQIAAHLLNNQFALSGGFGVCLFFLLSSYLITELLLQERAKTGTVHLKAFYVRRILRIWPLYYLAVTIAVIVGLFVHWCALTPAEILYLLFFVGWLGGDFRANPMGPLWSISVEEMFYAIWPAIAKISGSRSILIASLAIVPVSLLVSAYTTNWYNPVTKFILFALGALLALWLRTTNFSLPVGLRGPAALVALTCWGFTVNHPLPISPASVRVVDQIILCLACALLFLALYNWHVPSAARPFIYLGQISYGLYVFHLLIYDFVAKYLLPRATFLTSQTARMLFEYAVTLALTIALAATSFHFFETPFLKLKRRFTFVRSRD